MSWLSSRPLRDPATEAEISRRGSIRSTGIAAAATIAPFSFVRIVSARTDRLHRFLRQKLEACNTPGIAVSVVKGDEVVFADGVGWAAREHGLRVTPQTSKRGCSPSSPDPRGTRHGCRRFSTRAE